MSEQNPGGAQTDESSAQVDTQVESTTIKKEDHDRALKDMHKYKSDLKKIQADYQALLSKQKEDEESKLAQQNEFKTLAERFKAEAEKERKEKKELLDSFYLNQKMSAVRSSALKAGLRTEAETDLDLLSLDAVALERTDQGRVIVHGADEYVQDLKKQKPHWFSAKQVANVNSGGGTNAATGGEITPKDIVALEWAAKKDPKKREEYLKGLEQYRKQQKAKSK